MVFKFKKQVNLIIKDRLLRYIVSTNSTIESIVDSGEIILEPGLLEDGKLINDKSLQVVLEQLVKNKKWNNLPLSFCVPDSSVTIREQLVPKGLTKEEIKSYINMELEESIRLPFIDPIIDFVIIGEEKDQAKILLFAYPKQRVNEFLQIFQKSGLKPKVADLSSLSIYRLYYQLDLPEDNEHLLLVQWGKDASVLTAFNQNKPVFTRYIKSTLDRNSWSWSTADNDLLWTGDDEEISQLIEDQLVTIDRFMEFYQYSVMDGNEEISKILLTGDFPNLEQIELLLKDRFIVTIDSMKKMEDKLKHPAKYADAIGLAVKSKNK
ncbi:hypothetical protein GH741_09755 [Aquibacillus halophilus]|uniref:Pilus assembly protein PilM n=1 Tax=Aquibacillus halophilus TaxID=930132 RepID=A0A6A8DGJ9_9BACI|nr:pilus assembly protein PilM [Aquibacillus halophilus]MRH42969.1 hypothetical protein [Aquibacillus halophilus]